MDREATRVADIGDVVEHLQRVDKAAAGIEATLELKADKPAIAALQIGVGATTDEIAETQPRSVVSDRLLIEIARDEGGNMEKAATGDPQALLKKLLRNPKLIAPPKKKGKKSVWHSNKAVGS